MLDRHLISYIQGTASPELSQLIKSWLKESIEHQRIFDNLCKILKSVDLLKEHKRLNTNEAWDKIDSSISPDE